MVESIWLLSWRTDWEDGSGQDTRHLAFTTEEGAVSFGEKMLGQQLIQECIPPDKHKDYIDIFRFKRDNGTHYCSSILVKQVHLAE